MIDNVFNLLFRCRHRRMTRPLTSITAGGVPQGEAYVACLDCGLHFAYDTREMRMGKRLPKAASPTPHAEPHRNNWTRLAALITVPLALIAGLFIRGRTK